MAASRRILGNLEDAQDAVQEGFLATFRGLDTFDSRCRISTWLFRIVMNHSLMKLRRRKPVSEVSVEDLLPTFTDYGHHSASVPSWRPEASMESEETRALVREHIDQLPDTYRVPLILRDIEERPLAEVAELLGITPNAVKIRVHRARQALRAMLADRLQEVAE